MEWKVIVGQVCLTAIAVSCIWCKENHGILYAVIGALATSIGYPAVVAALQKVNEQVK